MRETPSSSPWPRDLFSFFFPSLSFLKLESRVLFLAVGEQNSRPCNFIICYVEAALQLRSSTDRISRRLAESDCSAL